MPGSVDSLVVDSASPEDGGLLEGTVCSSAGLVPGSVDALVVDSVPAVNGGVLVSVPLADGTDGGPLVGVGVSTEVA